MVPRFDRYRLAVECPVKFQYFPIIFRDIKAYCTSKLERIHLDDKCVISMRTVSFQSYQYYPSDISVISVIMVSSQSCQYHPSDITLISIRTMSSQFWPYHTIGIDLFRKQPEISILVPNFCTSIRISAQVFEFRCKSMVSGDSYPDKSSEAIPYPASRITYRHPTPDSVRTTETDIDPWPPCPRYSQDAWENGQSPTVVND
jgi:hypothetical protein